jgi:predicted O-linked N-acetylglucosamine transferase (SPINDLY family)
MSVWADILRSVPSSKLLIHARQGAHRQRVQAFFEQRGIAPSRIEFAGFVAVADYFALYRRIDIALDTFPYGGGTTTCDGLWMGVPIITLAGKTAVGRGGESILSNLKMRELIAATEADYVGLASDLAGDITRLLDLRDTLRSRMENSPLTNAPRFARDVEAAFRQMCVR